MLPRFWPLENAWVGAVSLAWLEIRVLENGRAAKPGLLTLAPHSRAREECLIRNAIYVLPMQVQEE